MIFTWDKDFDEALANPEALEKRLVDLEKQRRTSGKLAIFTTSVAFLSIFAIIFSASKKSHEAPTVTITAALTMVLGAIHQTGTALAAQADLRTLKVYRKLQELGLAARKQP